MSTMVTIERRVQSVLLGMFAALLVAIVMAFAFTRYMTTTSGWVLRFPHVFMLAQ